MNPSDIIILIIVFVFLAAAAIWYFTEREKDDILAGVVVRPVRSRRIIAKKGK